jgi:hypothetical protein
LRDVGVIVLPARRLARVDRRAVKLRLELAKNEDVAGELPRAKDRI